MNTLDVSVFFLTQLLPGLVYVWMAAIAWLVVTIIWYMLQRGAASRDADENEGVTMNACIYGGDDGEQPAPELVVCERVVEDEPAKAAEDEAPGDRVDIVPLTTPHEFCGRLAAHEGLYGVSFSHQERLALYTIMVDTEIERAELARLEAERLALQLAQTKQRTAVQP